jgi:hypothetical protein
MDSIKAKANFSSGDAEEKPPVWERPKGGTHAWDKPQAQATDAPKVTAEVQSAKLKQLLGKIKSG